jgi:hypothetical protein
MYAGHASCCCHIFSVPCRHLRGHTIAILSGGAVADAIMGALSHGHEGKIHGLAK